MTSAAGLPPFLTPPEPPLPLEPGRWPVRCAQLANGLKIRLLEDHALPVCAMQIFFGVGSRDDMPGASGVSHFLEHMMFNGTPRVGPRMFDRILEAHGGQSNAFTTRDVTSYESAFPADALECALRLESDRMKGLALVPDVLNSELAVVMEERRVSTEESIGGRLDEALFALAFRVHPYRRPVIGLGDELEHLDAEACRAHFGRYYVPRNATLWLAGDFDSEKALSLIGELFGPLPDVPFSRPRLPSEPPQMDERRTEITFPAHSESILAGFRAPAADEEDAAAASLLAFLLSGTPGARLVRQFVYEEKLAVSASADFAWLEEPGLFTIQLDLPPGLPSETALKKLDDFLARIAADGFTDDEIAQAKADCRASLVKALSTCQGRCDLFGMNEALLGSWEKTFELDRATALLTNDELRAAAARLFDARGRSVVILRPGERSGFGMPEDGGDFADDADDTDEEIPDSADGESDAGFDEVSDEAACALLTAPPLLPRKLSLPVFAENTSSGGMLLSAARHAAVPLFSLVVSLPAGSAMEPDGKDGLADFTMELLLRGTQRLSADALDAALTRLGCSAGVTTGADRAILSLLAPSESLVPVLELAGEILMRPAFSPGEIDAARERTIARLKIELDDPATVVSEVLCRAAFGDHPFSRSGRGAPSAVALFTREDVLLMAQRLLCPEGAVLTIAGDLDPQRTLDILQNIFGSWMPAPGRILPVIPPVPPPVFGALVAHIPGAAQAQLILASRAPCKTAPGHLPASIASFILGGSFTSRLMEAVRVERGLSYGLSAALSGSALAGLFTVSSFTKNSSVGDLISVVLNETRTFREEGLREGELSRARRSLAGLMPFSLETASQLARAQSEVIRLGRPRDYLEHSLERLLSVGEEAILREARQWLLTGPVCVAAAGDADAIAAQLEAEVSGPVRVISRDELCR